MFELQRSTPVQPESEQTPPESGRPVRDPGQQFEPPAPPQSPPDPEPERLHWLDVLGGVLFQPQATFRRLAEQPPLGFALVVFVAVSVINSSINARLTPLVPPGAIPGFDVPVGAQAGLLTVGLLIISGIMLFSFAAIFHLAAELQGGRGSARALLTLLALAQLPLAFSAPLGLIEARTGVATLTSTAGLVITLWRFYLYYRAVRVVYDLPRGSSIGTLLTPLLLGGLMLIAASLMLTGAFSQYWPLLEGMELPFP